MKTSLGNINTFLHLSGTIGNVNTSLVGYMKKSKQMWETETPSYILRRQEKHPSCAKVKYVNKLRENINTFLQLQRPQETNNTIFFLHLQRLLGKQKHPFINQKGNHEGNQINCGKHKHITWEAEIFLCRLHEKRAFFHVDHVENRHFFSSRPHGKRTVDYMGNQNTFYHCILQKLFPGFYFFLASNSWLHWSYSRIETSVLN